MAEAHRNIGAEIAARHTLRPPSEDAIREIFLFIGNLPKLIEMSGEEIVGAALTAYPAASDGEILAAVSSALSVIEAEAYIAQAAKVRRQVDAIVKKFGERK